MPRLSATLITYNEERDLPQVLASLQGIADEIVVVDSGSIDRTREVALRAGARVVQRTFNGFGEQKNFAASQAQHDWVLSVDADEVLSPELRESLMEWKARTQPDCAGYKIARRTHYLGKWIRHSGWYPEYHLRLYRRDRGRFVGALHESVRADGPIGLLKGDLLHYTVRSLSEHYAKMEVFTTLAAEDLYSRGRRRWRGAMCLGAPWTLASIFLFRLGFLDGYHGALIAWTSARYVWMKYAKLGRLVRGDRLERHTWPQAGDA
jgi:glycosyltransferase involved in cell wall biosynthesis